MKTFDDIIERLGFSRGTRKFNETLNLTKAKIGTLPTDFDWPSEIEFETLWLDYQDQITHLPENLSVGVFLDLRGCKSLTHLPENLLMGAYLNLQGCKSLTHLPENLSVVESLDLHGCESLTHLPKNLSMGGYLNLHGCTSLIYLSENLSVGGFLDIYGCESITYLPENLSVGGYLNLQGCTGLTHIPDNLSVGTSLYLRGCTGLTHLPENLSVEGEIYFDNNVSVPAKAFKNGLIYVESKFKVENPDYAALREIFFNTRNAERRRHLINVLGPDHTAKMLDAVEFKTGKVGKERVRILRTREKDGMIRSRHYWVEVRCPSTDRMYMLPIPPSRAKSCVDAVAYTFGLTGKEYAPLIET